MPPLFSWKLQPVTTMVESFTTIPPPPRLVELPKKLHWSTTPLVLLYRIAPPVICELFLLNIHCVTIVLSPPTLSAPP